MLLSSHHMPIPLQPAFLPFLFASPHFIGPTCYFIPYFVQFRLRPQLIYFRVPSSLSTSLPPYTSAVLITVLCISPWSSRSFSCRTTPPPLSSSSPTRSALCGRLQNPVNVDPTHVKIFTIFTVSPCRWISASWCSRYPKYSVVFHQLIFNPRSSTALLHSSSLLSTCSLLVLQTTMSSANSVHQMGCCLMPSPSQLVSCQTGRYSVMIIGLAAF